MSDPVIEEAWADGFLMSTSSYWKARALAAEARLDAPVGAAQEVLGVQQWMALDLDMALGHREHPAPNENGGRASWADWWSELLVEVRDLTAAAILHDYEIKAGRGGAGDE